MKLIVVLAIALILASSVPALPSNPRTNNFASSDQYSPRDDARMSENRGLRFEDAGSYDTDPIKNTKTHTGGGRPSPSFNNNNNRKSPQEPPLQHNPQGPPHQYNPQGPSTSNENYQNGGDFGPSLPGIRPHQGTMDSHMRPPPQDSHLRPRPQDSHMKPRPQATNFPVTPSGFPIGSSADYDETIEMKPAFEGCEMHDNSVNAKQTQGHFETPAEPMKNKSQIALYPMTEDNHALYVKVMMPSRQYKVKIQGTIMRLEKCQRFGMACQFEDEASIKSNNLIQPQQWNYMYSHISDGKITIGIGPVAKVTTTTNIPAEELKNAEWIISSGDELRSTDAAGHGTNGGPFVMQFPCAEYVAQHFSSTEWPQDPSTDDGYSHGPGFTAPQMGYSTEPTKGGVDEEGSSDHTAAIVVGVVVALLLIALLVAIAISIHRKRSFKVSESTPLSDKKKAAATSHEQQQPHQSPQQEVDLHDEK